MVVFNIRCSYSELLEDTVNVNKSSSICMVAFR